MGLGVLVQSVPRVQVAKLARIGLSIAVGDEHKDMGEGWTGRKNVHKKSKF